MVQRPALHPGEDRAVEGLRVLLAAEHEPGARPGERLVRVDVTKSQCGTGFGWSPAATRPGEVRHVAEEVRADLVGDRAEALGLDRARVRRAAADDQLRPVLLREPRGTSSKSTRLVSRSTP